MHYFSEPHSQALSYTAKNCSRTLTENLLDDLKINSVDAIVQVLNVNFRNRCYMQIKNLGILRDAWLNGCSEMQTLNAQALSDPEFRESLNSTFNLGLPEFDLEVYQIQFAKNHQTIANVVFTINSFFELFLNQFSIVAPDIYSDLYATEVDLFCSNAQKTAQDLGLSGVACYTELSEQNLLPKTFQFENRLGRPVFEFDDGRKMYWFSNCLYH